MPQIQMPNGDIVNFPDGTNPVEIRAFVQKMFPNEPKYKDHGLGETALQGFAQGATVGFKDEIDGGGAVLDATYRPEAIANPWLMGQDMYSDNAPETVAQVRDIYEQARNDSRDRWTAMEKQNPKTALASILAGGLATGFGAYGGGLSATKTGLKALPAITADGAAWGSAYGLGETEDMGNFTQVREDVASGAALGVGLGFAGHYVGKGFGGAKNAIQDRWFRRLSPEQLKLKAASNIISKGINPNDVPNPGNLGDDTLVIDALGTYGERLARTVANRSPQAEYDLKSALYARKMGANDRLSNALLKAARLNPNTQPMVAELKKRAGDSKKSAVSKAYHEAEIAGEDIPLSAFDALKQGSPSIALAFKRAQRSGQDRALIEGRQSPTTLGVVQSAKEVLDDQAGKGFRTGANKAAGNFSALARLLRERMDEVTQGSQYANARKLAQRSMQRGNAFEDGAVRTKTTPQLSPVGGRYPNMAATRQGYAAEMVRKMGDKTNGNVTKLFASPNAKRTLEQVFGRRSDGVFQQIANEKLYDRAVNAVAGNSTTAKQLIDDGSVIEMIGGGVPTGVISSVLRKIAQKRPSKIKKHSEEITKLLLMPASRGFPKMVNPPLLPRGLSRASIHTIQAGEE